MASAGAFQFSPYSRAPTPAEMIYSQTGSGTALLSASGCVSTDGSDKARRNVLTWRPLKCDATKPNLLFNFDAAEEESSPRSRIMASSKSQASRQSEWVHRKCATLEVVQDTENRSACA